MALLVADFIVETSSAPGTSTTITLAGIADGPFRTYASAASSGQKVFYAITDNASGGLSEAGIGTFTAGAPNTLSRDTVKENSSGTLSRLNFIGTVFVYCTVPSTNMVYADENGNVAFPGIAVSATSLTLSGAMTSASANVTSNTTVGGTLGVTGASTIHNTTVVGTLDVTGITNLKATSVDSLDTPVGTHCNIKLANTTGVGNPSGNAITVNSVVSPPNDFTGLFVNHARPGSVMTIWQFNGAVIGSITIAGGGTSVQYNTTSDATLKLDDGQIVGAEAVDMLRALKPRWFRWKSNPDGESEPGFFAQQVYRHFPWAVSKGVGRKGGKHYRPWQMDNAKLMPVVVAALKDALLRIEVLEKTK